MLKIGDDVKIIKCCDSACPVRPVYLGKRGTITEINLDRPAPIHVAVDGLCVDSFWPEELLKI